MIILWCLVGSIKFFVFSLKNRKISLSGNGYGGMPSNHSAIMSWITTVIYINEGHNSPVLGLSLCVSFLIMMDANGLRRKIDECSNNKSKRKASHTIPEIIVGIAIGISFAFLTHKFMSI